MKSEGTLRPTAGRIETAPEAKARLAGELLASEFADWSPELRREFDRNGRNYVVGSQLLSETARVKVWQIRLAPGERLPAHKHVLDYFWTVLTDGVSVQHADDGTTRQVIYRAGDTMHSTFATGQYRFHDLNNVGTTDLVFLTVEHHRAAGDPGPRQV